MSRTVKLALIPGDGIGPEVVAEAVKVLDAVVPADVDFVVVREGTEGPYVGMGGVIRRGTPFEIANEVSVNTAHGVERVVRYAFAKAVQRRNRLTLVHKTNVLTFSGNLWQRTVD